MMDELLPCPFCGELPDVSPTDGGHEDNVIRGWRISCISRKCNVRPSMGGVLNPDKGKIIGYWNQRTPRPIELVEPDTSFVFSEVDVS